MLSCPGCGTELDPDAAFCTKCGKPVSATWRALTSTDSAIPGRILAIIFGAFGVFFGGGTVSALVHRVNGDNFGAIGLVLCWPLGLAVLANGLVVRKGPLFLRLICIAIGLVNLALPFGFMNFLFQ
jgi:hypothetical protein